MSVSRPAVSRRPASPRLLAAVLVFLAVQSTAVASLGTPLLPTVQHVERVSLAASQWTLTITLLAGAVATPLMGRLGDGRLRRLTTVGAVAVMLAGCVLSAIPVGFPAFLTGRALQGAGLGLVPLATAVARDDLPADRSRSAIVLIGVTTAAGIGIGYPLVGLLAQLLGLYAPFWFAAALSAVALVAALATLPPSPARPARVDAAGAALLGAGIAGLLLVLTQGPAWGWTSAATLAGAVVSAALLAAWAGWELRARHPLIELRLLGRRAVLAANLTAFGIAIGFYPLASLAVRFAQTPPSAGYGLGAPVVAAAAMLTPFSLASFAASRLAARAARRTSAELVVAASCVLLIASMVLFLVARDSYLGLVVIMAACGLGVGSAYAVNPLQITGGVPAAETGSAISFYQLVRTVGYAIASALSATVLVLSTPAGQPFPADAGYSVAALVSIAVLVATLAVSILFIMAGKKRS
ncbi:MAG TPA: MFS transporter [Streptosporangiaceae bacterium]|jgi:MFS family permease